MSAQDKIDRVRKNGGGGAATLHALLVQQKVAITNALPKHLDADRMIRLAWNAIKGNKKLLECSQISVMGAVMEACQLGLELDGVLGHAYLIPRKNRGRLEANFQIGYRGLVSLALRSPKVLDINAGVVHENDAFEYQEGTDGYLRHRRALTDRGERIACWSAAKLERGGYTFEILGADDIERAKKAAYRTDAKDSPWVLYTDEMWKKTAARKNAKYLPLTPEVMRAVVADEYRERGYLDAVPVIDVTGVLVEESDEKPEPTHDPKAGELSPDEEAALEKAAIIDEARG